MKDEKAKEKALYTVITDAVHKARNEWSRYDEEEQGVVKLIEKGLQMLEYANQQKPQAQYSTSHQVKELILIANREGLYDAADFLRNANQHPEQGKVREAAESAFNQARKQTSILGEKDVQMTDYLISPKYKTFEDYWNSKKQ